MQKEEFYFDSKDGKSKIHAVRYTPDSRGIVAVLQIVHGLAEYVERYEKFAEYMVQRGIVVVGEDHLGHGKTVGEDGTLGYFCEKYPAAVLVEDVHTLRVLTQKQYPNVPYFMAGHSMGSFMVREYLSFYGKGLAGSILLGTGTYSQGSLRMGMFLVAIQKAIFGGKHVSKLLNYIAFGSNNKRINNARTAVDWLCKDKEVVDAYVADPLCGFLFTVNGFEALFRLIYGFYEEDKLERIPEELPMFLVGGKEDPVGNYGTDVRWAYFLLVLARIKNIKYKIYDNSRHELLNDTEKDIVTEDIYNWIQGNMLT